MQALSRKQQQALLAEVLKRTEPRPGVPEFIDQVLALLEDVPGFESANDTEVAQFIVQLMELYRDQVRKRKAGKGSQA